MKNVMMICFAVLVMMSAKAQTQRGSFLIGGTASFQRTDYTVPYVNYVDHPTKSNWLQLNPQVGYFVMNNLAIGLTPTVSRSWVSSDNKGTTLGLGPFVRYYFPFGKFAVFPEVKASFNNTTSRYKGTNPVTGDPTNITMKFKDRVYAGGVGFVWFAAKNIGVEAILSYNKTKNGERNSSLLAMNFGFQFYLARN